MTDDWQALWRAWPLLWLLWPAPAAAQLAPAPKFERTPDDFMAPPADAPCRATAIFRNPFTGKRVKLEGEYRPNENRPVFRVRTDPGERPARVAGELYEPTPLTTIGVEQAARQLGGGWELESVTPAEPCPPPPERPRKPVPAPPPEPPLEPAPGAPARREAPPPAPPEPPALLRRPPSRAAIPAAAFGEDRPDDFGWAQNRRASIALSPLGGGAGRAAIGGGSFDLRLVAGSVDLTAQGRAIARDGATAYGGSLGLQRGFGDGVAGIFFDYDRLDLGSEAPAVVDRARLEAWQAGGAVAIRIAPETRFVGRAGVDVWRRRGAATRASALVDAGIEHFVSPRSRLSAQGFYDSARATRRGGRLSIESRPAPGISWGATAMIARGIFGGFVNLTLAFGRGGKRSLAEDHAGEGALRPDYALTPLFALLLAEPGLTPPTAPLPAPLPTPAPTPTPTPAPTPAPTPTPPTTPPDTTPAPPPPARPGG